MHHHFFQKNPGKVITKFNFNMLFSQEALVPANIIAGFKKCGVYPYNPAAISVPEVTNKTNHDGKGAGRASLVNEGSGGFTKEQCKLFNGHLMKAMTSILMQSIVAGLRNITLMLCLLNHH